MLLIFNWLLHTVLSIYFSLHTLEVKMAAAVIFEIEWEQDLIQTNGKCFCYLENFSCSSMIKS